MFYLFSKLLWLMFGNSDWKLIENFLSLKIVINECLLHLHVMISLHFFICKHREVIEISLPVVFL